MVELIMSDITDTPQFLCSATVVGIRTLITAAHCLDDPSVAFVDVITGSGTIRATSFAFHPDWDATGISQELEANDVGIVQMGTDLPTRISPVLSDNDFIVGEQGFIGGYGLDQNGGIEVLRGAPVLIDSFTGSSVTITYSGQGNLGNTCSGDSGGPLFVKRGAEWVLGAVTSNGLNVNCGPGDVSNFANLSDPTNEDFFNSFVPGLFN